MRWNGCLASRRILTLKTIAFDTFFTRRQRHLSIVSPDLSSETICCRWIPRRLFWNSIHKGISAVTRAVVWLSITTAFSTLLPVTTLHPSIRPQERSEQYTADHQS